MVLALIGKREHSVELIVTTSNDELDFLLATIVDLLAANTHFDAFEVGTSHHVDHAGDRVGAIQCSATIKQCLNAVHRNHGHQLLDIGIVCTGRASPGGCATLTV